MDPQIDDDIYKDIIEEQPDNIKTEDLPATTNTEMYFGDIANEDKLIPENERIPFEKNKDMNIHDPIENDQIGEMIKTDEKPTEEVLTKEEEKIQKLNFLRKLAELSASGIKLSQVYNMNSNLEMMKYEYELHSGIQSRKNGVSLMVDGLVLGINLLEYMNKEYNPFKLKLSGWAESINSDLTTYYSIFEELYDKYTKSGKGMAPEFKIIFALSGSALRFHFMNTFANNLPNLGMFGKDNPEMVEKMRQQAIQDTGKKTQHFENNHEEANKKISDLDQIRLRELEKLEIEKNMKQLNINPPPHLPPEFLRQFTPPMQNKQNEHEEIKKLNKNIRVEISNPKSSNPILGLSARRKKKKESIDEESTISTISINPDIDKIINKTKKKKENDKQSASSSIEVSENEIKSISISVGDKGKKKLKVKDKIIK